MEKSPNLVTLVPSHMTILLLISVTNSYGSWSNKLDCFYKMFFMEQPSLFALSCYCLK